MLSEESFNCKDFQSVLRGGQLQQYFMTVQSLYKKEAVYIQHYYYYYLEGIAQYGYKGKSRGKQASEASEQVGNVAILKS